MVFSTNLSCYIYFRMERSASITNSTPLTSSEEPNPASNSALTKMVPEFEVIYIFHKYIYARYLYKCKYISYGSQSCIHISLLWRKIFASFQQTNPADFQGQNLLGILYICKSICVHRFDQTHLSQSVENHLQELRKSKGGTKANSLLKQK